MRVYSWNVNGIRACVNKGFMNWLRRARGDVVALQETRVREEQLPPEIRRLRAWSVHLSAAERPGYSGVGILSRRSPDEVQTSLGEEAFDIEGRLQIARFGKLRLVNGYFPNGQGKNRDNSRIPYKLSFYQRLFDLLQEGFDNGDPILVMGDFNTAHQEIDLARPKDNKKTSGFTEVERKELDRWIQSGWIDTFRHFEKGPGHYTWWSQRPGVRAKNIGWRIDYMLASPGLMPFLREASIHPKVQGSDHCPISVDLDENVWES